MCDKFLRGLVLIGFFVLFLRINWKLDMCITLVFYFLNVYLQILILPN